MKTKSEIITNIEYYRRQKEEILELLMKDEIQPLSTIDNWISNLLDLNKRISELKWVLNISETRSADKD